MVVFSNNNYDFLLRDGSSTNAWGKLAPRPSLPGKDHIPFDLKVLIYTEGLNGVFLRKSSLAESRFVRRDLHVSASKRIGPGPGATSVLARDRFEGAASFASICTNVSFFLIDCDR